MEQFITDEGIRSSKWTSLKLDDAVIGESEFKSRTSIQIFMSFPQRSTPTQFTEYLKIVLRKRLKIYFS